MWKAEDVIRCSAGWVTERWTGLVWKALGSQLGSATGFLYDLKLITLCDMIPISTLVPSSFLLVSGLQLTLTVSSLRWKISW